MDDDRLEKLGDYFVHFRIRERYGIPLHVDDRRIVVMDGNAVCTYSRDYYRLPLERDAVVGRTPLQLDIGAEWHGILRPAYEGG